MPVPLPTQTPSLHGPSSCGDGVRLLLRRPHGVGVVVLEAVVDRYRAEPHGEYIVGHLAGDPLQIVRGRQRHTMQPGDLAVLDLSGAHRARAARGDSWHLRALLVEAPCLHDVLLDPDGCTLDLEIPNPVHRDRTLVSGFLRLHRLLVQPASVLEHQGALADWLAGLAGSVRGQRPGRSARRRGARHDPAFRRACELLCDEPTSDVDLETLAGAAGTSKFRLLRLFKAGLGMPPHRYQIQLRVQRARSLLEAGVTPSQVAPLVGFYDQSHLTRHFRRRFGVTPGRYARAVAGA